jgi:hypothetical protein
MYFTAERLLLIINISCSLLVPSQTIIDYVVFIVLAMLNEECQFHKINYNHIKDTPILSKARTSIPGCLALQPTSTFGNYNVYLG